MSDQPLSNYIPERRAQVAYLTASIAANKSIQDFEQWWKGQAWEDETDEMRRKVAYEAWMASRMALANGQLSEAFKNRG